MIEGPVAVVAPSGAFDPDRLAAGMAIARDHGFELAPLPHLLRPRRYLAGSDDHRAAQLIEALTAERYAAVWIVRGGYGLTRILHRLDAVELRRRPVIGFSDVTALFANLRTRRCGPLIHGPMLHSLPSTDEASQHHLWRMLAGDRVAPLAGTPWVEGTSTGPLVGGNLCMLASLCGTPWQLDVAGAVLVLEEVGEYPYRIDRTLQQLVSAGGLDGVAGIALGEFRDCRVPDGVDWTLRDVLMDHLGPLGVPVVADLPIGHGPRNHAFPWGVTATLGDGQLRW